MIDLAWLLWHLATRLAVVACVVLAVVYGGRGGLIPMFAWLGLAAVVVVLIVLVEDE